MAAAATAIGVRPQRPSSSRGLSANDGGALGRLTLLAGVQAFALVVFMLGFFLTRQEVPHHSHCQDAALWKESLPAEEAAAAAAEEGGSSGEAAAAACWAPPRFKRAVIVVIDALRFDFVAPVDLDPEEEEEDDDVEGGSRWRRRAATSSSGKGKKRAAASPEMYHINKLPVVRELLEADAARALLYRFEADPPTTTMQRLKGLTTGSLPTFLDLRQNFHSPAVAEDSLVRQLRQQGKRLTAMGDDTWQLLFPDAFHRSFPFPSFNTRDLDTVDNGVLRHLLPEMARDDWDVLIAHFLGVDHVGHTFGPSHPAMAAKLGQMDAALRGVVDALEEDTLLLLMGDHGMTDDGNHGGATREETEAALFLYTKSRTTPLVRRADSPSSSHGDGGGVFLWEDAAVHEDGQEEGGGGRLVPTRLQRGQAVPRRVAQVDLVPTLALLLGAAVPYANLGGIVPELFFHPLPTPPTSPPSSANASSRSSTGHQLLEAYATLARRLHANAAQLHRYLLRYAELAHLPPQDLAHLGATHEAARAAHAAAAAAAAAAKDGVGGEGEEVLALWRAACGGYRRFLRGSLELGRRVWTQYDVGLMLWALALLGASLLWAAAAAWAAEAAAAPVAVATTAAAAAAAADRLGVEWQRGGSKGGRHHQAPPSPTDPRLALRWALGGLAGALLLSGRFPRHFLQQGDDHAAVVIPAFLLTLVLTGLALPALAARAWRRWRAWRQQQQRERRQKAGGGTDGVRLRPTAPMVATLASLLLVALHGAGHFANSYIEAEERLCLFLGASAAGCLALLVPHHQGSSDAHALTALARHHLPWLLPGLLVRLSFEAKGHGQDVATHFGVLATVPPLLALLAAYYHYCRHHHRSSSSSSSSSSSQTQAGGGGGGKLKTALLGAAYALTLLYWATQADPAAHPACTAALRLAAPRAIYLTSALALLGRLSATATTATRNNGDSIPALCLDLAALLSPALLLVLGPAAPASLLCQAGSVAALYHLRSSSPHITLTAPDVVALALLGRAFFFATGHHSQFNRLQYSAAFVGVDEFDFALGGALLFLNTFGTELLSLCLAGAYAAAATAGERGHDADAHAATAHAAAAAVEGMLGLSALRAWLTSLCVLLQRRHLMVWAIFAPKFIFDAALHGVLSWGGVGLLWLLAWRGVGGRGRRNAPQKKLKV